MQNLRLQADLGEARLLPAPLAALHNVTGKQKAEALRASKRGNIHLRRLAALHGFQRWENVPVKVTFHRRDGELWQWICRQKIFNLSIGWAGVCG
jgi:hypothetical protein